MTGRQAWEQALSAQSEVLAMMASPDGQRMAHNWIADRTLKYGVGAAQPSAIAFDNMVDDLMIEEPLYVTDEMNRLVLDAMESFDASEPLIEEDFLFPAGFAYLAEPFLVADIRGKLTAFRAIAWRLCTMDVESEFSESEGVPLGIQRGVKVCLYSHVDDVDDYSEVVDRWNLAGHKWGVAHAVAMPLAIANDLKNVRGEGDTQARWLTYLRVLHRLMAERIVVSARKRVQRPVWREASRKGMPDVRDVVVVELRRVTVKREDESEGVHYSHRFMVRGHWRNQWYPSVKAHRQKWITPYVKGPEDGELILKERVWVWDR